MNEVLEVLLRRHRPDNESLSALLDGQLAGRQLDALQAHIASCEACRERLATLGRTRDALRSLPEVDAPRSFRLRAADVAAPAPVRRAPVAMRAMPILGAAAALVFVVVLEADLARGGSPTNGNQTASRQALSAGTIGAGVGQIGAADNGAPATADNAARASAGPVTVAPAPGKAFDSSSGGVGAPTPPEGAGSPRPALGGESGIVPPPPETPSNGAAAPQANVPAPVAPPTQAEQPSDAKSAATQHAPTSAAQQAAVAPTSSSERSVSSQSQNEGSTGSSDVAYRIVEALAAAIALAAIAGSLAWRMKNRKVGP